MFDRLQCILTDEQREMGFYLAQDDHSVFLRRRHECADDLIATFGSRATIPDIQYEATQATEWLKSGVSFKSLILTR